MKESCLFVEGLKMRPGAEKVLLALAAMDGLPEVFQTGNTIGEIAGRTGLTAHVIRARLQDLRRLGLVESDHVRLSPAANERRLRYGHYLTVAGAARAAVVEQGNEPPF